jgi:hypothetical protein
MRLGSLGPDYSIVRLLCARATFRLARSRRRCRGDLRRTPTSSVGSVQCWSTSGEGSAEHERRNGRAFHWSTPDAKLMDQQRAAALKVAACQAQVFRLPLQ